jgi:hypothetical protein
MMEARTWSVHITIDEHNGHTRAVARLHTRDTDRLTGIGLARLNPTDNDVPEIGDELAVSRALANLSDRLLTRRGRRRRCEHRRRRAPDLNPGTPRSPRSWIRTGHRQGRTYTVAIIPASSWSRMWRERRRGLHRPSQ